jgi:hypothetical protein
MATSSLLKSALHNSIAEGLYNEIQNRTARYYYFLGRTIQWTGDDTVPPFPVDSFDYELKTRSEIITMKEIKSTDVAFVVPRVDWVTGTVYDMYDDQYSDEVQGIDVISGGFGYSDPPTITITGGGGSGATAEAIVLDGVVVAIDLLTRGRGYTSSPTVEIAGGGGEGCAAAAVVVKGYSGTQLLEDTNNYVITDEFNVYKCLDNNNGAASTYKPIGTVVDPVIMPDGYMWKYLYSIPIALRNKFLTDAYMPVVNSLRSQFYSNGEIQNTIIESGGENYTFASIVVQGDGYRASDPLLLQNVAISSGGADYTSGATVAFEPPFAGANPWVEDIGVLLGQKIEHEGNIYEATLSGSLASPAPTHKSGEVKNGTAVLKYIGSTVTGQVTVSGGHVTGIILNGSVYDVNIIDGGSGYTAVPDVTISGGGGTGALGQAVMQGTSVAYVVVQDSGDNYTSAPDIVFGTEWEAATAYAVNQQIFYSNRLYTVTSAGTSGTTAPTHTSGSDSNGTVVLQYVGSPATGTISLKYGSGYSSLPGVSIQPVSGGSGATAYCQGVKSSAKLIPILDAGQIVGVSIVEGGIGYTYANISIAGDGTGAIITSDLSPGDINTLQANTELLTTDGRIMAYPVISGGFGYGTPPTITIEGDGEGAEAVAQVEAGKVIKITPTQYGIGYRWAKVTITGAGEGATARAVMAPFGGHGKDPINGMFARTLMFYSNISKDKNQGFEVNNDFRQLGIIKNPRQYGKTALLKTSLGSGCYVISGYVDVNNFSQDMLVTMGSASGPRFRIVALTSTGALLQSLDNAVPQVGSVFQNEEAEAFAASGVSNPTVDKYSGDLLFIDNKQAFTPTADQTVTLRTVIRF